MGNAPRKDGSFPQGGQAAGAGLFGLPGNGTFARRSPETGSAPEAKAGSLTRSSIVAPVALASSQHRAVLSIDELRAKYRLRSVEPSLVDDDETPVLPPTPAMLRAAYERDRREASISAHEDDHADTLRRRDGAGIIERAQALND